MSIRRFALACALASLLAPALAGADVVHSCIASVRDGYGRPLAGARVRFSLQTTIDVPPITIRTEERLTGADGTAAIAIPWFDGASVRLLCKAFSPGQREIRGNIATTIYDAPGALGAEVRVDAEVAPQWQAAPTFPGLVTGPAGWHGEGRSRLYLGADGVYDRVVVIPQGLDFFEQTENRTDADGLWFTFADLLKELYAREFDVWIFQPYLTGSNIHEQAAELAQAVQYASAHDGGALEGEVIVAGYSLGGLVARLTTARWESDPPWRTSLGLAEEAPVNLVVFGDAPLRGANVSHSVQRLLWTHGAGKKVNLASCAAAQLLRDNYACDEDGVPVCHESFFRLGSEIRFVADDAICDRRIGSVCVCDAGPALDSIGGDGLADGPELYAFSAGTWNPPFNLCHGGSEDRNAAGQDLCPRDPGGNGPFAPRPGDHWLSIRVWLFGQIYRTDHLAGWGEDLAPGSRLTLAWEQEPRILDLLPDVPLGGELQLLHNWTPTFIPIESALLGDSPDRVAFEDGHWRSGTYQASHNLPEPSLRSWLIEVLEGAYGGGGGPGPTGTAPAPPGNVQAMPVIGGWDQIDITWEDRSANEDRFEVQRKLGANGAWENAGWVPADETGFRDVVEQMPDAGGVFHYFYRVKAHNAHGNTTSNRAEARMYAEAPPAPDTLRPRGCVDELFPTLSWRGRGRTSRFYVRLLDAATGAEAMPDVEVRGNSVRSGSALAPRRPYMLRVWPQNNVGWGSGSAPEFFRTYCEPVDPPEWIEPVGCIDDLTPTMRWTEVPDSLGYHLRVYEVVDIQNDRLVIDAGPASASYDVPEGTLRAGRDYRAWVKPHTAGSHDPYSRIRFFSTSCPQATGAGYVAPISPRDELVATVRPEFLFEPASRADSYRIEVWNETGTQFVYGVDYAGAAICADGTCSARPDVSLPPGRYAWRVRAGRGSTFDPHAVWAWVRIPALPVVSVGPATALESEGALVHTLSLSAPPAVPVTVALATAEATALVGRDFVALDGQWTFSPGQTSLAVAVPLIDDAVHESSEQLGVDVTVVTGALAGTGEALGTIADDDPRPSISIDNRTGTEGGAGDSSTLELSLSLAGASDVPASVWVASSGCSADLGEDFFAEPDRRVVFAPGETSKSLKFAVQGDSGFEGDEVFSVTLSDPQEAQLGDARGRGRIRNDDPPRRGDRFPVPPRTDFDHDGRGDLLLRHLDSHELATWTLDGSDALSWTPVQSQSVPNAGWVIVGAPDSDRDGDADILWRNSISGTVVIWYMNGAIQSAGVALAGEDDPAWTVEATADFDRDGWSDLLWRHASTGELVVWRMQDRTRLARIPIANAPLRDAGWRLGAASDFDGDGHVDLLWHGPAGELVIWRLASMRFEEELDLDPATLTDPNWRIAGAWDVDADGWNDLLWQHAVSGRLVVWYLRDGARICGSDLAPDRPSDPRWSVTGLR